MRIGSAQRVDARAAVAAQHVRQRDLGVGLRDPRRVEVDRRPAVRRSRRRGPPATSSKIACETTSRGPSESVNSSPFGVEEHGAVGARRLGDRVALHRRAARRRRSGGTGARRGRAPRRRASSAIRVTSPVAFGWFVESSPRVLGLGEAAAARGEDDGRRASSVAGRRPRRRTTRQPLSAGSSAASACVRKGRAPPPAS